MRKQQIMTNITESCLEEEPAGSRSLRAADKASPIIAGLLSLLGLCGCGRGVESASGEPPVIPVGLDAYRMWARWPYQRIGVRAYMKGAYDRTGGNSDRANFLYQDRERFHVTLDESGPGVLYFARYNFWHGSPWHYEVDGVDHVIRESTTPNAEQGHLDTISLMRPEAHFIPRDALAKPLTLNYPETRGGNFIWVPIPFGDRFRMGYERTYYGTGYYIFHRYLADARLSSPLVPWDGRTPPDPAVLELLGQAGSDIAPRPETTEGQRLGVWAREGTLTIPEGAATRVIRFDSGPTMLRSFKLSVPAEDAVAFGEAHLRMTWDDRRAPSVDSPVALFFGTGTLHNREGKEYLVKALPVSVRFVGGRVELACYLPMPFFASAEIELVAPEGTRFDDVRWSARGHPFDDPPAHVGYFHASYVDHGEPVGGKDLVFLDTDRVEGGGPWSGSFIGTSFIFSEQAELTTLEGDPRFFFDDALSPQAYGTGTEEWGTGDWYWMGGEISTLPLGGHPVGVRTPDEAQVPEDLIHSAYRFLLADLMPFGKRAVIHFEHGGDNSSEERYRSLTYWYGAPAPSLILTDAMDVGTAASEAAHAYDSPDASDPVAITSRYEWGPDHEVFDSSFAVLAEPTDFVDLEFEARTGVSYHVWVRARGPGPDPFHSSWFQFGDRIGTDRAGPRFTGAMRLSNRWQWVANPPGGEVSGPLEFPADGVRRLRIQARRGIHHIDRIWLSTSQAVPPAVETQPVDRRPDEIVLDAQDVTRTEGAFALVTDPESTGQLIRVMRGPTRKGAEYFPAHTETGRTTRTFSEFTVALRPDNHGVMLRRTLDYSYPNQRAAVSVANTAEPDRWQDAGTWYLAGSNTHYHSLRPGVSHSGRGELGEPDPVVETSNRRFREDEFLIPARLTRGRSDIRVRLDFEPVERPLLPDLPLPEQAWSEIRYQAWSWVMPDFEP
jgi:hypothetical protein